MSVEVSVEDLDGGHRRVEVNGYRAAHTVGPLQEVLRAAGVAGRQWTSSSPIELAGPGGAHVELLLRAVKPLQRVERITTVAEGVAGMSREEASYWQAQSQRRHGLRALRILLDGGGRSR